MVRAAFLLLLVLAGCAGGDQLRIKEARDAYAARDFVRAEASLYTPEVLKKGESRLQHFLMLASIAFSSGQYEKAVMFLNKSREISNEVRSDHALFSWYDQAYGGNPVEYSYLHQYLVLAYTLLADEGKTEAWETPEIKNEKGEILISSEKHPARRFSSREVSELRIKARAELLAWDTHLETLKRTYGHRDYYQEDPWARLLAAYVHSLSNQPNEKRTAQILLARAQKEGSRDVQALGNNLQIRAQTTTPDPAGTLVVAQAGVIAPFRKQTTTIGLSTLFQGIDDPDLRAQMENLGFRVLLHYAPEFGLVALTGAVFGAASSDTEDAPTQFTDAADRGLGFQISFPSLPSPPKDAKLTLQLTSLEGQVSDIPLSVVAPIQEILRNELQARKKREFAGKALKIGLQYLAILIPAVKAYQSADGEGAGLKKLAILAGFFIAKKAIDAANAPDLRSWSTLPQLIGSCYLPDLKGEFDLKVRMETTQGISERSLGKRLLPPGPSGLLYLDLGKLP